MIEKASAERALISFIPIQELRLKVYPMGTYYLRIGGVMNQGEQYDLIARDLRICVLLFIKSSIISMYFKLLRAKGPYFRRRLWFGKTHSGVFIGKRL